MFDLDNVALYRQLDPSGMLGHLHQFPEQCQRAWEKIMAFSLPPEYSSINKVIILGMGGSAIGGDIVGRLALPEAKVPVSVLRGYNLPRFVDKKTLIIASSYSGNTEETLSAFTEALDTPARKIALTTGGKLKDLAAQHGVPVITIDYQSPPRAAFPHSFISLVGVFQKLRLLEDKSADLQEAVKTLNRLSQDFVETVPLASNPAKQLAAGLHGHIAVIYGAGILSEVARRWKTQFNENSKTWTFFELFSELNHNSVVGYQFPPGAKEIVHVVVLRSPLLHPRILLRYEATAHLMARAGINHEFVEASGESPLTQMLSLVLLGDYTSFYLALLNEVDPTSIDAINYMKEYLARYP
jgi:glucose/mannose-6-phosphate isomerase